MTLDELRARARAGAERARLLTKDAIDAWEEVSVTELAIAQHPDAPASERDIAERGHARASYTSVTIRHCPSRMPREIEKRLDPLPAGKLHETCSPMGRAETPGAKRFVLARILDAWTANPDTAKQRLGQLVANAAHLSASTVATIEDDDLCDWIERFSRGVR